MVELDLKDRKILYQLDMNCRQSNAQIGRKVGLSRKVVDYRIKRMEEEKIITGYWTAINTFRLGYYVFRIYINFIDLSNTLKEEIINYFCDANNIWAVITAKGPVDLDVILWVKDVYEFNLNWERTLQKYGMYFSDAMVSILTEVVSCRRSYLLLDKHEEDRVLYETSCRGNPANIERVDYRLLDLIAVNGRLPVVDLAKKLNCSSQTVNYRLKGLTKKGIIKAFRVAIDDSKLGLQGCSIDIYLKNHSKKKQVIDYIIRNPHVYDLMTKTIGWTDVAFEMMIERMDDIFTMIDRLEQQFPNSIRKQSYWMSQKIHKERWLPEMTEKDFEIT